MLIKILKSILSLGVVFAGFWLTQSGNNKWEEFGGILLAFLGMYSLIMIAHYKDPAKSSAEEENEPKEIDRIPKIVSGILLLLYGIWFSNSYIVILGLIGLLFALFRIRPLRSK